MAPAPSETGGVFPDTNAERQKMPLPSGVLKKKFTLPPVLSEHSASQYWVPAVNVTLVQLISYIPGGKDPVTLPSERRVLGTVAGLPATEEYIAHFTVEVAADFTRKPILVTVIVS